MTSSKSSSNKTNIYRNNFIWLGISLILSVIVIIQLNKIDDLKYNILELQRSVDINNYQEWGEHSLNQTTISYKDNGTNAYMSFYEAGSIIGGQYVGHGVLNKTIYLDFDFINNQCTLTIYKDFIEGKGNPEENYIINGNITKSSGFSFGRTR